MRTNIPQQIPLTGFGCVVQDSDSEARFPRPFLGKSKAMVDTMWNSQNTGYCTRTVQIGVGFTSFCDTKGSYTILNRTKAGKWRIQRKCRMCRERERLPLFFSAILHRTSPRTWGGTQDRLKEKWVRNIQDSTTNARLRYIPRRGI